MWGLWWIKQQWGRFSPSTSVSPANHSTNFSIIIITRGWHDRPIGGRSAEWTQLDSTPHYTNLKKKLTLHKAVIKSVTTYACLAWEFVADICLLKLQHLQNKLLPTTGIFQGAHWSAICFQPSVCI
jgi:hypothetical protein